MRAFDTRAKPFKPIVEFKVDTNFATTCDIWSEGNEDKYIATGHRGFNGAGAEVKLWDLRKVLAVTASDNVTSSALTNFVYDGHTFTPESVRFVKSLSDSAVDAKMNILAASKDSTISAIDRDGNQVSRVRNSDGFACMDILADTPFITPGASQRSRVVITADIKQHLQVYLFD